jgi:uncharacterized RDD family membrane protein YckC
MVKIGCHSAGFVGTDHMPSRAAYYRARETAREDELDGLQLATFSRRAAAFGIDFAVVSLLRKPVEFLAKRYGTHPWEQHTLINLPHVLDVIVLILYFCLALYLGDGQTIGKRVMRIRVISLTHQHLTLWQALERALGYGASFLEAGLGFAQFFIQRNRQCAHDRLAETIVIDAGKSATRRVDGADPARTDAGRTEGSDQATQTVTHDENSG